MMRPSPFWHAGAWRARYTAMAFVLVLSGCSTVPPLQPAPPPADYAALAARYLVSYPKLATQGALISELKGTHPPQLYDWFACIKLQDGRNYAIFYANGAVSDIRETVAVDRCPDAYSPLPAPKPPAKKPPERKKSGV